MIQKKHTMEVNLSEAAHDVIKMILESLHHPQRRFIYVDGSDVVSKDDFMRKVSALFNFQDYFGGNWDALEECLKDFSWGAEQDILIFYDQPEVFLNSDPGEARIAFDILRSVAEHQKNKQDIPALVFLHLSDQ